MERRRRVLALVVAVGIAVCGLFVENAASAKAASSQAPAKSHVVKQASHANAGTPSKAGQRAKVRADAKPPKRAKTAKTKTASTTTAGKKPSR